MEPFIVVQPRKKKTVTVSDATIVLNKVNTFSDLNNLNTSEEVIINTKIKTKTAKKSKDVKKKKSNEVKKKKRTTPSWELLLECAIRAEQIGRTGVEVYGRFYSANEIEDRCRFMSPIHPFKNMKSAYEIRTEG